MPLYLSADVLSGAVERLASSRARPSLCDFLILKNAMAAAGRPTVTLSLKDEIYMESVDRLALASPSGSDTATPEPYFNPFGGARENKHGWRTVKYPSNGPPDTVNGPSWRPITEIVSQGPRVIRLRQGYEEHLNAIVLQIGGEAPSILDAAAWFFRFDDIQESVVESPDEESIVQAFAAAVGLTLTERQILFGEGV
jgi:hypothetical protein